jgi:hypothetical protein
MGEFCISLDTRAGTLGDQFLEPIILPNRPTGAMYYRFLVNDLQVFLEHVPLHQQHMWFMDDEVPDHFLRSVRQHMNQTLSKQWIGRGDPVNWRVRSPDLIPLDFWLWDT